jgi:hypothetical protein
MLSTFEDDMFGISMWNFPSGEALELQERTNEFQAKLFVSFRREIRKDNLNNVEHNVNIKAIQNPSRQGSWNQNWDSKLLQCTWRDWLIKIWPHSNLSQTREGTHIYIRWTCFLITSNNFLWSFIHQNVWSLVYTQNHFKHELQAICWACEREFTTGEINLRKLSDAKSWYQCFL